ncbi:unnamed protein product [Notodromas monacha]|uniref:Uncharacterized protein n=1 Tax=Notodromas monacha TaxID=399045 RepID=A0A7R9GET7_9CRUS|nr:unnamed protein product [Notodromas monacha]CAG0918607.1 unnamed protein product [Notodromas monacha]
MLSLVNQVGIAEKSHEDDIQALAYQGGKLFSAGEDSFIKVWDLICQTDNNEKTLQLQDEICKRNASISSLAVHSGSLYIGHYDGTIQALRLPELQESVMLVVGAHDDSVTKIVSVGDTVFSGGQDAAVKVWKDGNLTLVLSVVEEVFDLAVDGMMIFSVRDRGVTIQELLSLTESNKFSIKASLEGKSPIALTKQYFFATGSDGRGILRYDRNNYNEKPTELRGHELIINCLKSVEFDGCNEGSEILFSAGWDGVVNAWNPVSGVRLASCNVGFPVHAMCCGESGHVFVGGPQGNIAIVRFTSAS